MQLLPILAYFRACLVLLSIFYLSLNEVNINSIKIVTEIRNFKKIIDEKTGAYLNC